VTPQRPQLYETLKAYAVAALPILQVAMTQRPVPAIQRTRWETSPGQEDVFVSRADVTLLWQDIVMRQAITLHDLAEYHESVRLLRSDPEIASQLDTMVGTMLGSRRVDANQLIDGLLSRLLADAAGFSEAKFDEVYGSMESALLDADVTYVLVAPLSAFQCDEQSIELGDGWAIERLTMGERIRALDVGVVRSTLGEYPVAWHVPTHAIRFTQGLPKIVGERRNEVPTGLQEFYQKVETVLERVPHVLRLYKSGNIGVLGRLSYVDNPFFAMGTEFSLAPASAPLWFLQPYSLSADEVAEFKLLWGSLLSDGVSRTKYLDVAIRRFGYKAERFRPDDQTIDLAIAAEAIFLTEGEADTRAEQAYRLAMRAAHFIESPRWSKRQVYKLMRAAYRVRNAIVHGGSLPKLKLPDGNDVDLGAFNLAFEEELRRAIKKCISMAARERGHGLLVDWEGLVFGQEPRGTSDEADSGGHDQNRP
jgi:Apea-like HEPN